MKGKSQLNKKIPSIALFGFSLFYFFSCFRLKMGTLHNPGPGLIPGVIGGFLVICTTIYLIRVFGKKSFRGERGETVPEAGRNYRAIIGILACTIVYPLILETLKFLLSTFTVAFVMLVLLKPKRPFFSLLLALGMAVASFLIFSRLLGVPLPSGFLEILLFRIGG